MAFEIRSDQVSSYLNYLPAIFQQSVDGQAAPFVGRLLLAFEKVLSGLGDPDERGLEEIVESIHTYFDPAQAPAEFLSWLASWLALSLREDWEEEEKRRFISRIVPLYRLRGTRAGLAEMLRTYTRLPVEIREYPDPLQIGVTSILGVDTMIGGGPDHFFSVHMFLEQSNLFSLKKRIAEAIINQEKPAHTFYILQIETPAFQIGKRSTVGFDTLLGTPIETS
jgi:phage tail-like protein